MRLSLYDVSGGERFESSRRESHELSRKVSTENNDHQHRDKSVIDANIKRRGGEHKVSYTMRLTVGPVHQADAAVLGCSRETFLFVKMLARNQIRGKVLKPGGERSKLS